MESAIISTASSLDEVLEKLNKDEKERKIGRKEMENIFDNIVNNGEGESEKCFNVNEKCEWYLTFTMHIFIFFLEFLSYIISIGILISFLYLEITQFNDFLLK